ncbi:hypothetical protein GCM10010151_72740 [Actinoallomurus spadix]|uniref:Uncharacterized protein n=1 Tax=Actinoallomurus spadix TaxID=79912 RepID=A0ABN0XU11_9ACTN
MITPSATGASVSHGSPIPGRLGPAPAGNRSSTAGPHEVAARIEQVFAVAAETLPRAWSAA